MRALPERGSPRNLLRRCTGVWHHIRTSTWHIFMAAALSRGRVALCSGRSSDVVSYARQRRDS